MLKSEARGLAAQAWCQETTMHLKMDPDLAEAFADILVDARKFGKSSSAKIKGTINATVSLDRKQATISADTIFAKEFVRVLDSEIGQPRLGLATCQELLDELSARIEVHGPGLKYRTVGGEEHVQKTKTPQGIGESYFPRGYGA